MEQEDLLVVSPKEDYNFHDFLLIGKSRNSLSLIGGDDMNGGAAAATELLQLTSTVHQGAELSQSPTNNSIGPIDRPHMSVLTATRNVTLCGLEHARTREQIIYP